MLWGNRTTPSRATGETPFFLVYGAEACLPPEIHLGSPRVQAFDESMQEQLRRDDVDFVDERRWRAAIRNARYNQALRHYHQRFVHSRELRAGDLILRRILNRADEDMTNTHMTKAQAKIEFKAQSTLKSDLFASPV